MDKVPETFVTHIIEEALLAMQYVEGMSKQDFKKDPKTQDAVVRKIEIIGEASSNLVKSFRDKYPKVPWRKIIDMRNVLIHEYWDIDLNFVWSVVNKKLKPLVKELRKLKEAHE